ncbi:rho guanine nucleotide exchange factor 38 [Nothobranchius furzeri]|uniref:Dynamin-binding protein n=1 Tax=Nothobranchius furzeri TaxID=105023 RepID=A0A8C6NJ00_NOTFU|nr:rho guanine nucleotide exchange factor 38 [Nothobranchius furzeri]XP_015799200.1 rho guanine nucleotide exchange factor 38 [Nothobranchius furzeri]XP_015799201.1 rho guanine nucleotide exchange factor 38 [Nothobranchius furzeri]XP_015799203.1 rho guanine nucleotide exchange factor 38 [Nothobranchius furzeri]XP_015799204.1 rho guanine nucleotide exchange factor 38 [Nothobranchius furzeri]XP_054600800.1 rho guanine nucleotide exchange factor 38 [Nothobranchius furzeri]
MDPKEGSGTEKEKEKVIRKRPRPVFLRYLERRKTDTIVADDTAKGDINLGTLVRRSQSDKTEYSAKLKEKLMPCDLSTLPSPVMDLEEVCSKKMNRRAKVIKELVQTEKDYLTDLELCIREVVQPLRNLQVVDVDRIFTNMETVCEVSAALLHRLNEAMADPDPEAVVIGEVFIQAKAALEDVYKIYCYHHDDANMSLKSYEKDEQIKQHFTACVLALKKIYDKECKPNLLDMGSLIIKPVQRIMKYPLLLGELWQATPEDHPDYLPLQEALTAAKIINVNINEFKRRKDIVMKYKRLEDEGTLRGKLNKLNIHSIRKKGDRFAGYLKILTGVESQVRDEVFDREEKLFRSLEKAVRLLAKNVHCYMQHSQEMVSVAVQNAKELENIILDPSKNDTNGSSHNNGNDPYKHFRDRMERLVLAPLSSLQGMFTAPQKLIQKRYDKLLDYCSRLERSSSSLSTTSASSSPSEAPPGPAKRDYEAINALLVEELQRFNMAAYIILSNCVLCLVTLLRALMGKALVGAPSVHQLPPPLSNIAEVQNSIMDELNNLTFVKDNAQKLIERKVSFEKREKKTAVPEVQHQTEEQRSWLLSEYPLSRLYQLKRKCNGCQEQDLSLLEGELVALLEEKDPLGSSSRWLVDTGGAQGYIYSTFLKQYNPLRDSQRSSQKSNEQQQQQQQPPPAMADEDFDDLSLFVLGSGSSSLWSVSLKTSDSSSTLSSLQGELESGEESVDPVETDSQQYYAVYAFQARCNQELSLQEYQHVRILKFCDLGGNKEWWLAEANGQKGYVPANYLGRMSYA